MLSVQRVSVVRLPETAQPVQAETGSESGSVSAMSAGSQKRAVFSSPATSLTSTVPARHFDSQPEDDRLKDLSIVAAESGEGSIVATDAAFGGTVDWLSLL
ncbi:MAG: hypothetical protein R3C49_21580 [Planctomycetaceae bacterium]